MLRNSPDSYYLKTGVSTSDVIIRLIKMKIIASGSRHTTGNACKKNPTALMPVGSLIFIPLFGKFLKLFLLYLFTYDALVF